MRKGQLLFVPSGGLANRMRAIASAYTLTQQTDSDLQVVWFQDWALHAPFRSIFEETPLVAVREATLVDHLIYDRARKKNFFLPALPQRMLFPEIIQFSPSEGVVVRRILPDLAAMGFELSDMGQDAYALNGVPAGLEGINYVTLVRQMVSDATEKERAMGKELYQTLALSMARHAAIPQGQILNNEEMEYLVNELFACSNVNYTPDGKPVLCILPQQEIEQLLA